MRHCAGSAAILVLSAAGADDIPDIQQLIADLLQLSHIFDLEPDGEHTPSAG